MQSSGADNIQIKPKVYDEFIVILKSTLLVNGCDFSNLYYDDLDNDLKIKIVFLCAVEEHLEALGYKKISTIRRYQYTSEQFDQKKTSAANLSILNAPFKHKLPFQNRKRKWRALWKVDNDDSEVDITGGASFKRVKSQKVQDEERFYCDKKGKSIHARSRFCEKKYIKEKEEHLSSLLGKKKFKKLINRICIQLRLSSQQSLVGGKSTSCT